MLEHILFKQKTDNIHIQYPHKCMIKLKQMWYKCGKNKYPEKKTLDLSRVSYDDHGNITRASDLN